MKKKTFILSFISVGVIGGVWFGYNEYNRKVKDLADVKAQITMQTNELITAFEKDEKIANAQYLDKIIAVKGNVKTIEKDDRGNYSIVLGDNGSMSSVRCSMDSVHVKDVSSIKEGIEVVVKGACTGFNSDELLGSDVILNRCVLVSSK
jgi:hypothetical protein